MADNGEEKKINYSDFIKESEEFEREVELEENRRTNRIKNKIKSENGQEILKEIKKENYSGKRTRKNRRKKANLNIFEEYGNYGKEEEKAEEEKTFFSFFDKFKKKEAEAEEVKIEVEEPEDVVFSKEFEYLALDEEYQEVDFDPEEAKKAERQKKRFKIGFFAVLAFVLVYFVFGQIYYSNRFLPNTYINGVSCSNKSIKEVSEIFKDKIKNYHLKIVEDEKVVDEIYGSDIDLKYGDMDTVLKDISKSQIKFLWAFRVLGEKEDVKTNSGLKYDTDILHQFIKSSLVLSIEPSVKSQNASLEFVDGKYQIKKAVVGDEIDKNAFYNNVIFCINSLDENLDIKNDNCFVMPTVYENDKEIVRACREANRIIKFDLTISIDDDKFNVPTEVKKDWIGVDSSGNLKVLTENFDQYIDKLNKSYGKSESEIDFKTYHGDSVKVKGGDFFKSINREKFITDMESAILSEIDREVVVEFEKKEVEDIGQSYIEVDLSNQMLWLTLNGKTVLSTPIVSGDESREKATSEGVYRLKGKSEKVEILEKGEKKSVDKFIFINSQNGICDSSWKTFFGGTAYKNDGSDGYIYVPKDKMETIFANTTLNMPIIYYHHKIIESYFQEDSYMNELMELIRNKPEIPTYSGESGNESEEEGEEKPETKEEQKKDEEKVEEETNLEATTEKSEEVLENSSES